ncbi:MAG: BON domain-containing protein [Alphaproteobacteria bacterium]|nr:BON domain-containing protein [Alphaproteobacteria bacterium]
MNNQNNKLILLPVLLVALGLSGCVPLILGGAGAGAEMAAQERTPGHTVDDAGIYLKIKERFASAPTNDLFANVEIKVVEGRVLLTGNVDKPESQIEAVNLVWQVSGVKEVINEIQVNDKAGFSNYARDVWISTQVRTKLLFTKGIRSVNYSVITVNQAVYLMGIAQNQEELDRATTVAGTVQYVQKVVSYVRLKDDPRRP